MPELPEVETLKRELQKTVVGEKIAGVSVHNPRVVRFPKVEDFVKGLKGTAIKNIIRKGKLLVFELSSGKSLAIHLKMTGQLIYPGDGRASRISFRFSDGKLLDFNDRRLFGELRLVDDWHTLPFVKGLGPEPQELSEARFKVMLSGKKTKIKPLIMDQTFLSGVGNLYAAEALYRAKINPARTAESLSDKERARLFKEINATLNEAIRFHGSSVDQYLRLSGIQGGYVKFHKVYDRKGKPCLVCKALIQRITLGGRGTYFCPRCQK